MADSTTCISALLENVPAWVSELEEILRSAAVKQEEILFENRPSTPQRADSKACKAWSLRSKRSRDMNEGAGSSIRLKVLRPALPHLTDSDALRLSQRKRKTASISSDQVSGPTAIRQKLAAVVYYDGNTQKRFEKLVRSIGLSRNAIRKGKMAAKVDSLSRTGSSGSEGSCSSGGEDDVDHKLNFKSTRPPRLTTFSRNDGSEVYNNVDGELEKAQSFCERAAYQVLKDGDCTLEVDHAKERFAEALRISKAELPGMKKRADKAVERQRRSDERRKAEEEMEARRAATALAMKARMQATVATQSVAIPSDDRSLEVDALEADDSDSEGDSDGELNVASMQFGKLSQMRTARLAAAL